MTCEEEKEKLLVALKNLLRTQKSERLNKEQVREWYIACEQALTVIREMREKEE